MTRTPLRPEQATHEYPMLFSQQFIPKLLDGSKTVTRRPLKPQPESMYEQYKNVGTPTELWVGDNRPVYQSSYAKHYIPWKVGTVLWVRETWAYTNDYDGNYILDKRKALYRADRESITPYRWRPSIHMPRWAARIFLLVKSVDVERLQSITRADISAEGIEPQHLEKNDKFFHKEDVPFITFQEFWDAAYPKVPAHSNPWVSVTRFERLTDYSGAKP